MLGLMDYSEVGVRKADFGWRQRDRWLVGSGPEDAIRVCLKMVDIAIGARRSGLFGESIDEWGREGARKTKDKKGGFGEPFYTCKKKKKNRSTDRIEGPLTLTLLSTHKQSPPADMHSVRCSTE